MASKVLSKPGNRSKYTNDDLNKMCDLRIKMKYTFTGAETMTPIFISVLGPNDRELPKDHCVSLKIKGLWDGGGRVTFGNTKCGTLMFMRGDAGMNRQQYQIYRDEILLPFIRKTRSEFGGWIEGSPIPKDMKTVSWCDCALAQIY